MSHSFLLKIFITTALLGFTASVITLWAIRSSLTGVIHVAHRTAGSLTYTRLPLPRK